MGRCNFNATLSCKHGEIANCLAIKSKREACNKAISADGKVVSGKGGIGATYKVTSAVKSNAVIETSVIDLNLVTNVDNSACIIFGRIAGILVLLACYECENFVVDINVSDLVILRSDIKCFFIVNLDILFGILCKIKLFLCILCKANAEEYSRSNYCCKDQNSANQSNDVNRRESL